MGSSRKVYIFFLQISFRFWWSVECASAEFSPCDKRLCWCPATWWCGWWKDKWACPRVMSSQSLSPDSWSANEDPKACSMCWKIFLSSSNSRYRFQQQGAIQLSSTFQCVSSFWNEKSLFLDKYNSYLNMNFVVP